MQSVEFTHPQSVYHIRALSLLEDLCAEDATRILLAPSSTHFIVEKVIHVHRAPCFTWIGLNMSKMYSIDTKQIEKINTNFSFTSISLLSLCYQLQSGGASVEIEFTATSTANSTDRITAWKRCRESFFWFPSNQIIIQFSKKIFSQDLRRTAFSILWK